MRVQCLGSAAVVLLLSGAASHAGKPAQPEKLAKACVEKYQKKGVESNPCQSLRQLVLTGAEADRIGAIAVVPYGTLLDGVVQSAPTAAVRDAAIRKLLQLPASSVGSVRLSFGSNAVGQVTDQELLLKLTLSWNLENADREAAARGLRDPSKAEQLIKIRVGPAIKLAVLPLITSQEALAALAGDSQEAPAVREAAALRVKGDERLLALFRTMPRVSPGELAKLEAKLAADQREAARERHLRVFECGGRLSNRTNCHGIAGNSAEGRAQLSEWALEAAKSSVSGSRQVDLAIVRNLEQQPSILSVLEGTTDKEVRVAAISRLQSGDKLLAVVQAEKDPEVSAAACRQMKVAPPELLLELAKVPERCTGQAVELVAAFLKAIPQSTNQRLLSEVAVKRSEDAVALAAAERVDAQPLLLEIALTGRQTAVRLAAGGRITEQGLLVQLVSRTRDEAMAQATAPKLAGVDYRTLLGLVVKARGEGWRMALKALLTDESKLLVIAKDPGVPVEERLAALPGINNQTALLRLASDAREAPEIRKTAAGRLTRVKALPEAVAWLRARALNSTTGYDQYLASFAKGPHAAEARDERGWREAVALDSPAGYSRYLERFPRGGYADNARERRDCPTFLTGTLGQEFSTPLMGDGDSTYMGLRLNTADGGAYRIQYDASTKGLPQVWKIMGVAMLSPRNYSVRGKLAGNVIRACRLE
jgi:hypothetical protein